MTRPFIRLSILLLVAMVLNGCRSAGEFGSEPEQLIERSRLTFQSMMKDNQYPSLVSLTARAKAIIIMPDVMKGAFFFGGRGGNGIMLARDAHGSWSQPAFYTLGGLSFGLQFGAQSSELVIAVMTERGLNALLDRQVTLGGEAGLAVGEMGKGASAATGIGYKADMYAFARSEGVFVGVSLDGSVLAPRNTWNQQLYGPQATPRAIMINRSVTASTPAITNLVNAMP